MSMELSTTGPWPAQHPAPCLTGMAVDPHSFYADPDPAFFLNADPDPGPGPA